MSNGKEHIYVLSLGGSLVVPPEGIDTQFLIDFNQFIREEVETGKKFFIVVGGGSTTRKYQEAARKVRGEQIEDSDLDWLGIHATRLNAQMIRTIFRDIADPRVIKHYEIILKIDQPVAIAAGWKPGWSTDYCAVTLAQDYSIPTVVNLTNIDQVYDADPKKDSNAKPMSSISWDEYRAMAGNVWIPGMNLPFDPIASKLAQELDITVKIVNGKNLQNLKKALESNDFFGTVIS